MMLRLWLSHTMGDIADTILCPPHRLRGQPWAPTLTPGDSLMSRPITPSGHGAKADTSLRLSLSPGHKSLSHVRRCAAASPISDASAFTAPLGQSGSCCSVWLPPQVHPLSTQSPAFSRAAARSHPTSYPTRLEPSRAPPRDTSPHSNLPPNDLL